MRSLGAFLAIATLAAPAAFAADGNPAYTDVAKAPASYALQGEYTGEIAGADQQKVKLGVQIIAQPKGKFEAVAYHGGLPGEGWDKQPPQRTTSEVKDGELKFENEGFYATVKEGALHLFAKEGNTKIGELQKIDRTSPTLGAKPPEGAIILFDGANADAWENGKVTEDGLLKVGVKSKQKFHSFVLHLEFRTPYMPESQGQARGNSGCYLHGCYELQILDSFGLKGLNNECGGFYQQHDPSENMCLPPLAWQTYDIDFTEAKFDESGKKTAKARVTVKHNGVVIHDDFEFAKETPGGVAPEGPAAGPLMLQDHGNPVNFRNIWIVEKK